MTTAKEADADPASIGRFNTEDARLEARVAERTEELSTLSTHLVRMIENERSQLAKELHDELGGLITAAKMDMAWLQGHLGGSLDAAGEEKFRSVVQMLNQAMVLKRRVVESLRPSLLEHFGLPVALRSHFDEECRNAGVECIVTLPDEIVDLDPPVQLALFRIAQESLVNLLARGQAKHVELVIEPHKEQLSEGYLMTIGDDGNAMDLPQLRSLVGMRHRVRSSGGRLEADAVAGQGNRIRAYVPRSPAKSG
jgi:signal transduction histidine kinase